MYNEKNKAAAVNETKTIMDRRTLCLYSVERSHRNDEVVIKGEASCVNGWLGSLGLYWVLIPKVPNHYHSFTSSPCMDFVLL